MSVCQGLVYICVYDMQQLPVLDDLLEDDNSTEEHVKYGQLIHELTR